jgi:lysophospholipase L1-like esterase
MRYLLLIFLTLSALAQTRSVVNTGANPNDGTGDTLRTFGGKVNTNFYQLWQTVYTNGVAVLGGTNQLTKSWNLLGRTNTVDISLEDLRRFEATATDSTVTGISSLYLDGGTVTLRASTNLQFITPAVLGLTAQVGDVFTITDRTNGAIEFQSLASALSATVGDPALSVGTIADLIASTGSVDYIVATKGYATQGDGGHGLYRWTNALPAGVVTNTGTWFAGSSGFWGLIQDGQVSGGVFGKSRITNAVILGDSITQGASASSSATRWHQVVSSTMTWVGTQVAAWGGARIEDIAWQIMPGMIVTNSSYSPTTIYESPTASQISSGDVMLALVGYNDQRGGGTDLTRRTHFANTLRGIVGWWCLQDKTMAQDADSETGAWTDLTFYGGQIGRTAATAGPTITFTNVFGDAVYVAVQADTTGTSTYTVTVDGVNRGTFNTGPSFYNAAAFAPSYVGPNGNGTIDENPWAIRIGGLGMSRHTVTVSVASVAGGPVSVLWVGGSANTKYPGEGPIALIGNTLRSTPAGYNSGSDAGVSAYNSDLTLLIEQMRRDGLAVVLVDACQTFDPDTGMSGDNVHPNDLGHAQIAEAFIHSVSDANSRLVSTEVKSELLNRFTLTPTTLTLRVPNTSNLGDRTFVWNGGALPFRSAAFASPSIAGSFDYLSGSSVHASGSQRFWDAEHTLVESGTASSVGLSFRTYISSIGSGSHYPLLVQSVSGSDFWNNIRADLYGGGLLEGTATSGGRSWVFREPTGTASQVTIQYANSALARRLLITGNGVIAYDTNGVVANLALGASGVNVAVQGGATVGQALSVTGASTLTGGLNVGYRGVTASETVPATAVSLNVNDSSGSVVLTLPAATTAGKWLAIKKTGGNNSTTVNAADGGANVTLATGESLLLESNGSQWQIKAAYRTRNTVISQTGDYTHIPGSFNPVIIHATAGNSTITLGSTGFTAGEGVSIVRPGTAAFTVNVGPGLKTIPSATAATVDCIFDGSNWVLWRYTEN